MTDDPWQLDRLDLQGYLARVGGLPVRPPSVEALDDLCRAHALTFPFDNVDVLRGQHPGVALPQVVDKFVGRGRGGYCFEHVTLFAAVLARLGYDVERRLGRVGGDARARTHLVALVRLDGQERIADVGIGRPAGASLLLEDGAQVEAAGWRHRVVVGTAQEPSWTVQRWGREGWEHVHTFDDLPVRPVDLLMGHHWTSSHPSSHFLTSLHFGRYVAADEHVGVSVDAAGPAVTTRRAGRPTERREVGVDEAVGLMTELGRLSGQEADELAPALDRLMQGAQTA